MERQQWLAQSWAASLRQALESVTGQNPAVEWTAEAGLVESAGGEAVLWWEQEFDLVPGPALWVGLPERTWTLFGTRASRAAEARSAALEILKQALAAMAQALGDRLQRPVSATGGREAPGAPQGAAPRTALVRFSDADPAPFQIACSELLACALEEPPPAPVQAAAGRQAQVLKTLDLLRDVELPVSVSFGRTRMALGEVLKLTAGSVIELDRSINDPVSLIVNDTVVALGEVVVVEGNYGLRIQQIMSRESLLRFSGVR